MKSAFIALLLLAAASLSCNKSDDTTTPGGGTGTVERSWKVGSTSYTVNNYARSSETYSAYDKDGNSINFTFASYPPPAGTYHVINDAATLGAGEMKVYVGSMGSNANTYLATGSDKTHATVTFENTRIKIVLPESWAKKSGGSDSLKISASLAPLQ